MIDLAGIGNLLEYLVAADNITCEERDRIILRIAKENDIAEYMFTSRTGETAPCRAGGIRMSTWTA